MPRATEHAEESAIDDSDNDGEKIKITRRDAIISAVAAGVATSVGTGAVVAASDFDININDWDTEAIYNQFEDAQIDNFELGENTTMSIRYDAMDDSYIVGEVALKVNDGNYVTFGSAKDESLDPTGGQVTFDSADLWNESDPNNNIPFDFSNLDIIDPDNDGDYENLTFTPPSVGDESGAQLAEMNDLTLRFRFVSEQGTLSEKKELMLTMAVGVPLGFGQYFGANFGKDHVEPWPDDWNA